MGNTELCHTSSVPQERCPLIRTRGVVFDLWQFRWTEGTLTHAIGCRHFTRLSSETSRFALSARPRRWPTWGVCSDYCGLHHYLNTTVAHQTCHLQQVSQNTAPTLCSVFDGIQHPGTTALAGPLIHLSRSAIWFSRLLFGLWGRQRPMVRIVDKW